MSKQSANVARGEKKLMAGSRNRTVIEVADIKFTCPIYKKGNRLVFDGPLLNLKETDAVCMHAIQSLAWRLIWERGDEGCLREGEEEGWSWFICPLPGEPYTSCGRAIFRFRRESVHNKEAV